MKHSTPERPSLPTYRQQSPDLSTQHMNQLATTLTAVLPAQFAINDSIIEVTLSVPWRPGLPPPAVPHQGCGGRGASAIPGATPAHHKGPAQQRPARAVVKHSIDIQSTALNACPMYMQTDTASTAPLLCGFATALPQQVEHKCFI